MAYPNYPQGSRSSIATLDGLTLDRASNGSVRGRSLWSSSKRLFSVEHVLTATDLDALRTFYDANKTTAFDFVWAGNGETYSVVFRGMSNAAHLGGGYWRVSAELEES